MLARHGLEARKSLGQNFLVPGAAERIARIAQLGKDDWVVEIGPGLGALTDELCERAARVIAIDLDEKMIGVLRRELATRENLELVHADALKTDFAPLAGRAGRKLRLVGNLPYYISSPLIRHAIAQRAHLVDATFTLQKEVAERIAAKPGSKTYGALSVLVQLFCDASVEAKLAPGSFHPRPGVDSAVLRLVFLPVPRAEVDFAKFERVVFASFEHRRKTILNSMRDAGVDGAADALARAGIDPKRRAETLSVPEFAKLTAAVGER